MNVGTKIARERKRKGYTQQQRADLCGISKRAVASYETDGRAPHQSTLRKIASALGCTAAYLLDDTIEEYVVPAQDRRYINSLRETYGEQTAAEIEDMIHKNAALFAGGTIDQDAKDQYFLALINAYIECKVEENGYEAGIYDPNIRSNPIIL